jgi:hypothetical protein
LSHRLVLTAFFLFLASAPPALAVPPANDNFANATNLTGPAGSITGSTIDATKEAGEPNHAGEPGGRSLWYRWAAPRDGLVTFDSCATSGFDSLLAVYTGSAVNALSEVESNDDEPACPFGRSRVVFPATAGLIYRIAVDGFGAAQGPVLLSWNLVDLPAENQIRPAISGVPMEGELITATTGLWLRADSLAYSWQRCSQAGTTTNVARGKPVRASREEVAHPATLAVDGDFYSYWGAGDFPPQWIEVELGSSYPVSQVRLAITMLPDGVTTNAVYGRVAGQGYQYAFVSARNAPTVDEAWLEFPAPAAFELESILVDSSASPSWIGWREIEALSPCVEIAGATGSSYRLTADDVGSTVRAVVKATNGGGTRAAAAARTATVALHSPVNTVKPLVTGEPQVGLKLSVDTGTWAAKPPVEYSFQWQSCDAALTSCANITGATDVDYFPLAFDVGSKLRAVVTATNPGGKTSATSEPTDLVRGRPVPRRCVVPRLKRKTLSQARAALRRRHCRLGVVRHAHSARVRRGRVIAQRPAAGNRLREGARVNVTLSSGRRK